MPIVPLETLPWILIAIVATRWMLVCLRRAIERHGLRESLLDADVGVRADPRDGGGFDPRELVASAD